jgi:hypothetical protein
VNSNSFNRSTSRDRASFIGKRRHQQDENRDRGPEDRGIDEDRKNGMEAGDRFPRVQALSSPAGLPPTSASTFLGGFVPWVEESKCVGC